MGKQAGFGLLEIIIASAIISVALFALSDVFIFSSKLENASSNTLRANFLVEEGLEAMRFLRDKSWSANLAGLNAGTVYYVNFATSTGLWSVSTTDPGLIDNFFTRKVTVASVNRDASDNIVTSGGTLDPDTKKINVKVSWGTGGDENVVEFTDSTTDGDLANFPSNNAGNGDPAQSFTTPAGSSISVTKTDLYIKRATANPSDIFLEIRGGNSVGPVLATSQTIDSATLPSALTWTSFNFASPPSLSPSTVYHLRLRSIPDSTIAFSGSASLVHWGYRQTASSPYAGGSARRYVGRLNNPIDQGQELTQYDFGFKIFKLGSEGKSVGADSYLADIFDN